MKPIDKTAASQTETIAFEFDLPHPPAKVWRALTGSTEFDNSNLVDRLLHLTA